MKLLFNNHNQDYGLGQVGVKKLVLSDPSAATSQVFVWPRGKISFCTVIHGHSVITHVNHCSMKNVGLTDYLYTTAERSLSRIVFSKLSLLTCQKVGKVEAFPTII